MPGDNYLSLAVVFIASALLVGMVAYSQAVSCAGLYGSTLLSLSDGSDDTVWGQDPVASGNDGSKNLIALGREGVSEVRRSVMDTYIWAAVILAVGVFFAMRK